MKQPCFRLVVPSLLLLVAPARAEIVERIVAKVNGDIITLSEFQQRQVQEAQGARVTPDQITTFLRDNNARILQDAIDDLLLYQRAQDTGLKMRPEDITRYIDDIKKENNIASEEQFQEQLSREGMTLDELKRNMERNLMRQQIMRRDLESKVMVTETEIKANYDAHLADYSRPATVSLREILVKGDNALARANEIVAKARGGEDFAGLATAHSAAATKKAGGDLGRLVRGEMNPDLEKATLGLPVGAVSEPIPTADGYRIVRVEDKTDAGVVPFDEVKDKIQRTMGDDRMTKELASYMTGLREKAIIETMVREVPLELSGPAAQRKVAPAEAAPTEPGPSTPTGAATDDEFVTTPQDRPEQVTPGAAGAGPNQKKEASPGSPTPKP